jgi:hypothetical protein
MPPLDEGMMVAWFCDGKMTDAHLLLTVSADDAGSCVNPFFAHYQQRLVLCETQTRLV